MNEPEQVEVPRWKFLTVVMGIGALAVIVVQEIALAIWLIFK